MPRLIINGDDLGLSQGINESIFDLMDRGLMTSASVMVGGAAFREAAAGARSLLEKGAPVEFGLHLDLDGFFRFDEEGRYGVTESDIVPWFRNLWDADRSAILADMDRQAAALADAGIRPTHLDGHHHMHLFPWIIEAVLCLMKKYSINAMRFDRDFYEREENLVRAQHRIFLYGVRCPDHFIDCARLMREGAGILDGLEGTVEIMAHTHDDDNTMGRRDQYRYLLDNPFGRCKKISFGDI